MLKITKPSLVLNEKICKQNIRRMHEKALRNNVDFRPHFKTHQSKVVGRWFRERGISKITVSSLEMATYFAEDDWNDITVAFPVNILEYELINLLAAKIDLNLVVESVQHVEALSKFIKSNVNLFIKIDTGYHRTGIASKHVAEIEKILKEIERYDKMNFYGFLDHAGHSYYAKSKADIHKIHKESIQELLALKKYFIGSFPNLKLSTGDTPSCSIAEDFTAVNEIRPGNFVFYDLTQVAISSCRVDQIAVAMACPIVAIHEDRNEIIIYGGAAHFSKDVLIDDLDGKSYGYLVESKGNTWGDIIPQAFLKKLSQEHGTIVAPMEYIKRKAIGDIVYILPVHSCMTALAMREYISTDAKIIDHL